VSTTGLPRPDAWRYGYIRNERTCPKRAFAAAAANLTDEQFDEALAAARASDDLSRSGVARHFPPRQRRVTDIDGG